MLIILHKIAAFPFTNIFQNAFQTLLPEILIDVYTEKHSVVKKVLKHSKTIVNYFSHCETSQRPQYAMCIFLFPKCCSKVFPNSFHDIVPLPWNITWDWFSLDQFGN